ncbi:hypothetical protein [Aureispira sp. CCB-E]|uniref:hypothetical protein n=1 Tax=Aureispira sp. CCB-E TaxID=3051121 RepID=UPI0028692B41|nr:hypothetical protein [Aureispira sp. CCB-E]WMX17115.1 hypothetical protein QP953_12095 [Aureispira sp. CCB-E]
MSQPKPSKGNSWIEKLKESSFVRKLRDHLYSIAIAFCLGVIVSYITSEFRYFKVKCELDIPNIALSIITLFVGLYIADILQKQVNKTQNQYEYLSSKLDATWASFHKFCESLTYSEFIDTETIKVLNNQIIPSISFLQKLFNALDVDNACVIKLEKELVKLEELLSESPVEDNLVTFDRAIIDEQILVIDECLSSILKEIQLI